MSQSVPEHFKVFWIVWNPEGKNPQARHYDYADALKECQRLRENTKALCEFYILQACHREAQQVEVFTVIQESHSA